LLDTPGTTPVAIETMFAARPIPPPSEDPAPTLLPDPPHPPHQASANPRRLAIRMTADKKTAVPESTA
jgi:hypothetical protein